MDQLTQELDTNKHVLRLFSILDQAQGSHGIQHQDYKQYWTYCTAKLNRLRHVKPVRSLLVHNPKYAVGSHGIKRKNAYAKRDDSYTSSVSHVNILWNQLFQAERAWAHACSLQQHQQQSIGFTVQNSKQQRSKHGHVQRRLNKAFKHAKSLVDLVTRDDNEVMCDEQSIKECRAYLAWTEGNAELEHKNYPGAFRGYKKCLILLLELARCSDAYEDSKETLAMQDLWMSRAEASIRPLMRYCQYEAKDALTREDLQLPVIVGTASTENDEGGAIVLSFRNRDINLAKDSSYKELAVLYLKIESMIRHPAVLIKTAESEVEGTSSAPKSQFLQLLSDLDDAISLSQVEYNRYASLPPGPNVTSKRREVQTITAFFRYHKLNVWRYQQEARIKQLEKDHYEPEVLVHAYDGLLQNAQSIVDLLSQGDVDNTDDGLEDDSTWLEAQAHIIRIRAFRCFHLAILYESSPTLGGTTEQILGLLKHAQKLTKRANEEMAANEDDQNDDDDDYEDDGSSIIGRYLIELDKLSDKISVSLCRIEASIFIERSGGVGIIQTNRPLWLRLDDFDCGEGILTLADDPPLPLPMPCKGSFFDIAWQHIGYDFPVDAIEKVIEENEPKKQSGGFLGWLLSS